MLARSLKLVLDGKVVGETPMLVPAFSSKVTTDIGTVLKYLEEHLEDPILVSAFDVAHNKSMSERIPITCSGLIFLDSGGYECSHDADLADAVYPDYESGNWKKWTREKHAEELDKWPYNKPTVIISYDHPSVRDSVKKQIESAEELFKERKNILTEILLKPDGKSKFVKVESILPNIESLRNFDIIGLTEKELGGNLLERLEMVEVGWI